MKSIILLSIIPITIFLIEVNEPVFSQEPLKQFEDKNMGIRLSYPSYWDDYGLSLSLNSNHSYNMSCIRDICKADFDITEVENTTNKVGYIEIFSFDSEDPAFIEDCKCDSLIEFVRDSYNITIQIFNDKIFFINDNQTTIGKSYPAWQIEFNSTGFSPSRNLEFFVKSNNTFYYTILFGSDSNELYSRHLSQVREVVNSIEFLPVNKPKVPSFMSPDLG